MSYLVSQAKDDLAGIAHGKTVSKITVINGAGRRAARNLLATIDPHETIQIDTITLYDKIADYAAPAGLKGNKIIDIRPQFNSYSSRSPADNLSNRMSKDFDIRRNWGSWFTVMDVNGLKYLRIKAELSPSAISFDTLSVLTGWAATASASNLAVENLIYSQGALQFDMAAGVNPTAGYIQSQTITQQNMASIVNKSAAFVELYIPTAAALAAIISIDLRWGTDTVANYYNRTVTTAHLGALKVGKNILRFDWNGATKTGATIDATKIDSARITVNTNGTAISALIVSNLLFSVGQIWDIEYYSKYLFRTAAGVWSESITDDTDLVNLDETSFNGFLFEWALAALQQIQGKDAQADREFFRSQLYGKPTEQIEGFYPTYKKDNPSQAEKVTQTYYSNLGYRNRGGGRMRG